MWVTEWNEAVFTDESRICLQHHDGWIRVCRHRGERMLNSCVMHHHTGPALGIMVWGGIGYHSRTPLVRIAVLREAWKKCNRNIPDAARSLQGRLHFKITLWEVAQGEKEGREEVADEPRSGRPTTARTEENVDRVREVLRIDRPLSIQQIADTLHMSTFAVHGIVTDDLQMRKVCAKLVPKVLTQDQKELRVLRCQELLDLIQNEEDFLNSVVTGDES
ncbi:FLJ37770-like protein [Trichonephila clavipes]|nr:FLJ37770-like protein [Trichonephila clavipes]